MGVGAPLQPIVKSLRKPQFIGSCAGSPSLLWRWASSACWCSRSGFTTQIDTAFVNSRFATSPVRSSRSGLLGMDRVACPSSMKTRLRRAGLQIAGASIIALNLVAIVACVRELDTKWHPVYGNPEADLKKSLAVSAFLMLYGGGLLAIGFWKRSAFIRWQALILLVFTIGKTFLYDMRNLSQGYRILSFLGLGALLMTVSFAYQKDWLALREPQAAGESDVLGTPTNGEAP